MKEKRCTKRRHCAAAGHMLHTCLLRHHLGHHFETRKGEGGRKVSLPSAFRGWLCEEVTHHVHFNVSNNETVERFENTFFLSSVSLLSLAAGGK